MIEDDIFGGGQFLEELKWEERTGGTRLAKRRMQHEQELCAVEQHKLDRERCKCTGADGGVDVYVSLRRDEALKSGFEGAKLQDYLEWQEGIYVRNYRPPKALRLNDSSENNDEQDSKESLAEGLEQRMRARGHIKIKVIEQAQEIGSTGNSSSKSSRRRQR